MTNDKPEARTFSPRPPGATAALVLGDGTVLWGQGIGAAGASVGEVVFNTSMTGYQEVLTDPSYAGQIITFTFPHIGNVGTNQEDVESVTPAGARRHLARRHHPALQLALHPSSRRLDEGQQHRRHLGHRHPRPDPAHPRGRRPQRHDRSCSRRRVRSAGPVGQGRPNGRAWRAWTWPRMSAARQTYSWDQGLWACGKGYAQQTAPRFHVVAVDFGAKHNILRCLADAGCKVTVVPATATAEDVLGHKPDGVFLSNGPGDPAATGDYAVPMIQGVLKSGLPLFGICLGHQMLALALGGKTHKMDTGHRGANHPVKDLTTGKVEITSQNHGFAVIEDSLPADVTVTHRSLFDGSVEGLAVDGKPVFSVQYHPEASPGPQDSHYLFQRFVDLIERRG